VSLPNQDLPPPPDGWLEPADVIDHLKLPVGSDTSSISRYTVAAERYVRSWCHVPPSPKTDTPDLYDAAVMIAADLWADRQATGGVQSGGPDLGFFRLGDFSVHVQNLLDDHRKWSENFA
jgi:hypothetical protein